MPTNQTVDKVLIIGLDCADPGLVFDRFLDDLPNLRTLSQRSLFGTMESCVPPITIPAWTCMATSKDPGQLGVYGFRNRADWSYDKLTIATGLAVKEPRLWDIVGQAGGKSFVFGVPQTYPPAEINGWMIAGLLSPTVASQYTYPNDLKSEISAVAGEYLIDVTGFRTDRKDWLLERIYEMGRQRFQLARHFIGKYDWDMFWMVEMGPDRLHHGFWQYTDSKHHRYVKGNRYENVILDYYKFLDQQIGSLIELVDLDRTAVWIVSDHGAKCLTGGVCFKIGRAHV